MRAFGREALLIDGADLPRSCSAAAGALASARRAGRLPMVLDLIPAADTLVVVLLDRTSPADLARAARTIQAELDLLGSAPDLDPAVAPAVAGSEPTAESSSVIGKPAIEIAVHYDGPDLAEVAEMTGLTPAEVIEAHCATPWRVGFTGFAPGFAYLAGGDHRLRVPRRADPRTVVPAGAVGLAGPFSGIYPRATPGGWQLIGRTEATIFDPDRDPPSLLRPGYLVRFRPTSAGEPTPREVAPPTTTPRHPDQRAGQRIDRWADRWADQLTGQTTGPVVGAGEGTARHLHVESSGPLTLIEDEGRPGHSDSGVPRSGAADRAAYRLGARLVGNEPGAAALEVTAGGLAVRVLGGAATVALTGAIGPAEVDGRPIGHNSPVVLGEGSLLTVGPAVCGVRTYLSVRGGVAARPVLGSRSTDTFAGLGPEPVRVGDRLPIGPAGANPVLVDVAPVIAPGRADGVTTLVVSSGPHRQWFPSGAFGGSTRAWLVSSRSDRRAVRLDPAHPDGALARVLAAADRELVSTGMVRGAVQVAPNGHPVVFLADHPVTGGYPVIAVLTPDAADRAAQLVPGQLVRWRWVD